MAAQSTDEMDKLKSKLQVYEDLLKEQAGEIAALKAEVAYLKRQPQHQSSTTNSAASADQGPQASGSSNTPVRVKRADSPPPSVAGSSQDPFVIDDDDDDEPVSQRSNPSASVPRRADSKVEPGPGTMGTNLQSQPTPGPSRSVANLMKKRRSSPEPRGGAFPEYEPSSFSRRLDEDSPRKKPKLMVEVVIPPRNSAKRRACSESSRQVPPPPVPAPAPPPPPVTANDQDPGAPNDGWDMYDDWLNMSPLSSVPSTPSRASSPEVPGVLGGAQSQDEVSLLLRSVSRELTYYDPPASPPRRNASLSREREPSAKGSAAPAGNASEASQAGSSQDRNRDARHVRLPKSYTSQTKGSSQALPPIPAPVGSAGTRKRLTELTSYTVTLSDPALAHVVVNRKQMSILYGGSLMRMCVRAAGRDFIFPALNMNPFVPRTAGSPGLLFRSNDALPWKGDVQTVFVGLRQGEYRYCGQYRLCRADVLSAEEYRALSSQVKRKWADGLLKKPKFKDVRVRIATRRDHRREPTFQEIAAVVKDRSDAYQGHVSEQEIIKAYERGEERLLVWKMECIGFDEAFLKDLVSKL